MSSDVSLTILVFFTLMFVHYGIYINLYKHYCDMSDHTVDLFIMVLSFSILSLGHSCTSTYHIVVKILVGITVFRYSIRFVQIAEQGRIYILKEYSYVTFCHI